MATSDGTFGEMRFDQSDQSFVDASQPLEQSLRDAEAALEAAICAIKVGQPAPIKQVDEKVKAVWHAWMNLEALKQTHPSQPKEKGIVAYPVVGEKREMLPRRNTADLNAKARTGRDDVNAFHNTPDDDDANGDGTDLVVTAAALEHAQNQIDKYKNGDLNRITIPGHEMPAKCAFLLAAFACNATKPVSERVRPFPPNWVNAETLKIGKLLENGVIKSMPASPLKRFACFTSNITMLTSHFLPSDIGTIDNIKELEPGVNTTEDFMVAHGGETAETGKMLERVMLELGHQDHPVLCYNCFNFAEVTVEEYSKLTDSKKYAAPPHAIEIFFENELDKQVKDIVNNELLGDLIIFGASARDVVMSVLKTMEDVVVLEYSAQMAELAFEGMDAAAFRWSNNDTSHPYGKIIVKGKVKNFICVQAPGSNNGFNFSSSGEAGIAENVRTLIRAMDWLKYMHLEDITKDLRRAPLFTACCEFMFQSMEITEKAIKDVAPGTYKTRHDQQSEKGGKRTKEAHAAVAAAAKPGGAPASAADREIVRKGKAGGSKGGLALTKNDQVSVAVYSTSDAIVRAMFRGSVNSSNAVGIRVVGNARNQDSLRELIRWIEEANEHESDISTNFPETYWEIRAADGAPSLLNVDWTRVPPIELKGRKGMDELSFVVMGPA